eukprot:GILK01007269.1.p1 GENE.GILK01007269.1~~GILK01007269.1.p1  ORF type:complete len:238 (-),score=23.98 GILK01007269.1:114-827(-)
MAFCYLDIDVGDPNVFASEQAAFDRTTQFVKQNSAAYGLPDDVLSLDDAGKETVSELYNSDPQWVQKGPMRFAPPEPLTVGRIVIRLFTDDAPKTCENFQALCTGERGKGKESGKDLHYLRTRFHRIISGFMAQGGDITRNDGSGGDSIFGRKFNDEKGGLKLRHNKRGIVAMANSGKNSNSSQFYIMFGERASLDGKYVVFGEVVDGWSVLDKMEQAGTADGRPSADVVISGCGVL